MRINENLIRSLEEKIARLEQQKEELQRSNALLKRLSGAVEQGDDTVVITDRNGTIQYVNPAFERVTGYSAEEAIGRTPGIYKSGKHDRQLYETLWQTILSGRTFRFQFINRKQNGELYYTEETITPIKDDSGNITHFVSTGKDITQTKIAEHALAVSEKRYRQLFEENPLSMWVYDAETLSFLDVNKAAVLHYGFSREEFLSMTIKDIRPEEDVSDLMENIRTSGNDVQKTGPWRHRKKDGTVISVEIVSHAFLFAGREARLVLSNDITERLQAETELRQSEARYRALAEAARDHIFIVSREDTILYVNRYVAENLSLPLTKIIGKRRDNFFHSGVHSRQALNPKKVFQTGNPLRTETIVNLGGKKLWMDVQLVPLKSENGTVNAVMGVYRDITEGKLAEEALRAAEEKYRSIFENAMEGIFQSSPEGKFLTVNPALVRMLGYDDPTDLFANVTDLEQLLYADPDSRLKYRTLLETYGDVRGFESEVIRKDRTKIWISTNARAVRDARGILLCYEGIVQDITERKRAEEERQRFEKQLLQTQKIEAIGQLAGGVAHDYNNTLMAIGGFAEILLMKLPENNPLRELVLQIQKGVARGADLTRQLLAFSRRQTLAPKVLDLNQSIRGTEELLRRLISEDVQLVTALQKDLGHVKADPGQIHQVILNLAVNARDAMPDGGRLTIETNNVDLDDEYSRTHPYVTPGRYVQITISDTGVGMDETTISRIFDPFFTTKEEGRGTGLGLSTVYGIVKQSGGHISVYSQENRGTTFKVYLPWVDEPLAAQTTPLSVATLNGQGETILLVDDNQAIRDALGALLEMKGYKILVAESGSKALEIADEHKGSIHLLITDVIMPKMSGKELASRLSQDHPKIKVLYMSGYTYEVISRQGILEAGATFLSKPVSTQQLLLKIRELLGL